jgi:hypothetical protein
MKRTMTIGVCMVVGAALAGLAQPDKQPAGVDHPPAAHPNVPAPAEDWPKAKATDVASVDAILGAFYETTGGEAGQPRDWDRFRSLFLPDARLIPARARADGGCSALFLPVGDYIEQNRKYFEKIGFFDREAARRVEKFGNIAHVWSTYESRRTKDAPQPYSRGINSLQLLKDNDRWWIVNVYWDFERPDSPIPEKYLQSVND